MCATLVSEIGRQGLLPPTRLFQNLAKTRATMVLFDVGVAHRRAVAYRGQRNHHGMSPNGEDVQDFGMWFSLSSTITALRVEGWMSELSCSNTAFFRKICFF